MGPIRSGWTLTRGFSPAKFSAASCQDPSFDDEMLSVDLGTMNSHSYTFNKDSFMTFLMSPFAIPIVAIVGVFIYLCISAVVNCAQSIVKHRNEVELKQQLADRGMSADEIERIVMASSVNEEKHRT